MAEREGEELQAGPWGDERTQARLFHFGCRLAASLAHPLDDADPLPGYWGPMAGVDVLALARHPDFAAPLAHAVARRRAVPGLDGARLAHVAHRAGGRFALLIATAPRAEVAEVSRLVSAAVWHRRILRLALRADRARVRTLLGAENYNAATQEVPTLHPSLAFLDAGDPFWDRACGPDEADGARAVVEHGSGILLACTRNADPALAALAAARHGLDLDLAPPLPEALEQHLVKLVRRRVPSWSALIG
ncbi:hypothetical protein [Aureimonas jatrophae]|jgi:hypothetical protein|uniref:Uncharacterized protein n=1 Tax=Aureimonas jatrophae TaxID=1166073 RepID=A0A1H0ETE5_9HYPH|nr:hypothetical protein [Aureimonas jatrophae]MBB3950323.1 hypothetical protein [Aureimonas jatrophae]SDN85625.1 hypothetical protein SAMN05192530_102212 [Aureimonas jatrophae]